MCSSIPVSNIFVIPLSPGPLQDEQYDFDSSSNSSETSFDEDHIPNKVVPIAISPSEMQVLQPNFFQAWPNIAEHFKTHNWSAYSHENRLFFLPKQFPTIGFVELPTEGQFVGEGCFGKVVKIKLRHFGEFAVKSIPLHQVGSELGMVDEILERETTLEMIFARYRSRTEWTQQVLKRSSVSVRDRKIVRFACACWNLCKENHFEDEIVDIDRLRELVDFSLSRAQCANLVCAVLQMQFFIRSYRNYSHDAYILGSGLY